jgi:subtilisin family serine protease
MRPFDLIMLRPLMERTSGTAGIAIGLIDGPIAINHPDLAAESIREVPGKLCGQCDQAESAACMHGTFVAGILCGKRGSAAPAICPNCTLLVRPIFGEATPRDGQMPSATAEELAVAVIETIDAGARVLNLSAALVQVSSKGERDLEEALDHAARRGVLVVAAAGNQGTLGSSAITRHRWVVPVVACDFWGRPMRESNLCSSIGRQGLMAPGDGITSLGSDGKSRILGGTSAAAPFVTGAIALLWSEFPAATAGLLRSAVTQTVSLRRRATLIPPLLDAWETYRVLNMTLGGR